MNTPGSYNSCEQVKSYFEYYTVPKVALLWCGVPVDQVEEELALAKPSGDNTALSRAVLVHPYISCLEPRCRVIHDAIDNDLLPVGRDGGKAFLHSQIGPVAHHRRTLIRADLKEWIANTFPDDKPAFLFDEIERNSHPAINAESFRALQADRDALKVRVEKGIELYRELKQEHSRLLKERDLLVVDVEKNSVKFHGNTEINAKKREQVLGAALAVLTKWPEQCRNSAGKFEATKIAEVIDQKALLFWSETAEPTLSRQKMERLISKWINGVVK